MKKIIKKTVGLAITAFLIGIFASPAVFAQMDPAVPLTTAVECDNDGDGYVSLQVTGIEVILGDTFNPNGNYSAVEWSNFFNSFKNDPGSSELCLALNFKKGAEPARCDRDPIDANSGVYDPSKVQFVSGSQVYPGAFDKPDNGIDEDCDGSDGELVLTTGETKDLGSLVDRTISLLSRAVVVISIVVLIWGGILYATAAGDEAKTAKARKAIIGAVIGLIVGLLAPAVVNWITASLA
jgi:hypothetical protein